LAVLASAALAYLALTKFWLPKPAPAPSPVTSPSTPTTAISTKSIAVLPFVDMSEKHDQEYFSDGLSEELIDHLTHNPNLKVIARTSSFAFKGKNEDMRSIATKLGVANLLEGSVRKAEGELRITAQLIRASDGVHLWSEIYDRKLADIFKVQDEISTTVAKALNAALNAIPATGAQLASKGTSNIEAYNLVLKGTYFYDRLSKGDATKAVDFFLQALKLDPHYALAWAQLSRAYAWQGFIGDLPPSEAVAKGLSAVQRALTINPNCAEAYYARAQMLRLILGDWVAAKADYGAAAALDPYGEVGERAQGNILRINAAMSGQYGDFIGWERQHLERNPLDTDGISDLVWAQLFARHLDEAAATSRKLLELNPAFAGAEVQYGLVLLLMGKSSDALAAAKKESDEAAKLAALAAAYWSLGRRAESDSSLGELERRFADTSGYSIAGVYAYRGEPDSAFAWLDRAHLRRKGDLADLKSDPFFDKLHGDPRFDALLRKVKLIE
jgi:TolB-like protein